VMSCPDRHPKSGNPLIDERRSPDAASKGINYPVVYIRFIGTHRQYDMIEVITGMRQTGSSA